MPASSAQMLAYASYVRFVRVLCVQCSFAHMLADVSYIRFVCVLYVQCSFAQMLVAWLSFRFLVDVCIRGCRRTGVWRERGSDKINPMQMIPCEYIRTHAHARRGMHAHTHAHTETHKHTCVRTRT